MAWLVRGSDLRLASGNAQELRLQVKGSAIEASFSGAAQPLLLNVALIGFDLSNQVSSGENSGRRLNHDFVVLQHTSKLSENGQWQLELPAIEENPVATKAVAAWISQTDSLQPLQATGGWLTK